MQTTSRKFYLDDESCPDTETPLFNSEKILLCNNAKFAYYGRESNEDTFDTNESTKEEANNKDVNQCMPITQVEGSDTILDS